MVVPVFITSCQVSENPKSGPLIIQNKIMTTAKMKAIGDPTVMEVR